MSLAGKWKKFGIQGQETSHRHGPEDWKAGSFMVLVQRERQCVKRKTDYRLKRARDQSPGPWTVTTTSPVKH